MFIMPNGGCFISSNYKHTENYKRIELEIDDERYNAIMDHFKNWNKYANIFNNFINNQCNVTGIINFSKEWK